MKNYYLILGVESDVTMEQIRAAYLRQAKDLHPDYYGQDIGPFIDLQEAYAVLSDPARRRAYDDVKQARQCQNRTAVFEQARTRTVDSDPRAS
jgi:molecular chaperone DnaJ